MNKTKLEYIKEMLENGKPVVVKFNSNIYKHNEDKFDENMIAEVISVDERTDGFYEVDVNGFDYEEENRKVAKYDWLDEDDNPTLCWMDTPHYPETGMETIYVYGNDLDLPFEVIERPSDFLFANYKKSNYEGSYVEWLENLILKQ